MSSFKIENEPQETHGPLSGCYQSMDLCFCSGCVFRFEKSFLEGRVQREKGDYLRKQVKEAPQLGIKRTVGVSELFMRGSHEGERDWVLFADWQLSIGRIE